MCNQILHREWESSKTIFKHKTPDASEFILGASCFSPFSEYNKLDLDPESEFCGVFCYKSKYEQ